MKNSLRMCALHNALLLALALTATNAAKAQGQPTAKPPEKQVASRTLSPPSTPKNVLTFQSIFEQYKPYRDEKITPWKGANDEVGRIGGWRAYLKEANETEPVRAPDAKPANPQADHAGHPGHGGQR